MNKHSLKEKVVLVGGGAKNLGGLISRTFAGDDARICVHYNSDSTRKDADKTVADIKAAGGEAFAVQGDFTKVGDVAAAFAAAKKRFGGIDIAINTAGKVLRKPIVDTTEEEFDTMFDINAKAAFFFIKQAGIDLNEGGKIITIVTSLLAAFTDGYSTYAGGKAPVEDFTRAAAKECGQRGISVNAIGPGPMDTPFFYGQEKVDSVSFHNTHPMNGEQSNMLNIVHVVTF